MSATEQQPNYARPIGEIVRDLSKEIPSSRLKDKTVAGKKITFIPWYHATSLLDYYAPGWEYTISLQHIAEKVVAIASISIHAKEGTITREATGYEDDDKEGYGDPFSNAESMALRRAAAKFGLGRYLYNR